MLDRTCDRLDVWRPGQAQVFGIMAYDRRMAIWPFLGGSMAKSAGDPPHWILSCCCWACGAAGAGPAAAA